MTAAFAALGEVGAAEAATTASVGAASAEGAALAAPAAARGATVAGEAAVEGSQASSFSKNLATGMAKQAMKSTGTQQPGQRAGEGVEQELSPLPMLMSVKLPDTRSMPSTGSAEVDAMRNAAHDVVGTAGSVGKIGMAVAPFLL
jgi:hypothetical protein